MSDKTYVIYFEGKIEIKADSDEEAVAYLKDQVPMADVGYYKIYEYECRHLGSVQYEGTSDH